MSRSGKIAGHPDGGVARRIRPMAIGAVAPSPHDKDDARRPLDQKVDVMEGMEGIPIRFTRREIP